MDEFYILLYVLIFPTPIVVLQHDDHTWFKDESVSLFFEE